VREKELFAIILKLNILSHNYTLSKIYIYIEMDTTNDSNNDKKINIIGTNNRYQIKKVCRVKKKEKRNNIMPDLNTYTQQRILNQLFINNNCIDDNQDENAILISNEIKKKIYSYRSQDQKMKRNINNIINYDECVEKLIISKLKCYYCKCELYILFNKHLDHRQWTLDRIDNDISHTNNNCIISCLGCNLQRRRQSIKNFEFTKSLKIIKKDD